MTSAPLAKMCATRMPSVPTPSEDTCVPASRVMWAMAPSAEVIFCPRTVPQTHKTPNNINPNLPSHPSMVADPLLCNILVSLVWSTFTSPHQYAAAELMKIDSGWVQPGFLFMFCSSFASALFPVSCWTVGPARAPCPVKTTESCRCREEDGRKWEMFFFRLWGFVFSLYIANLLLFI